MEKEIIESSVRLGKQLAYGEMLDILNAELDKHASGSDAKAVIFTIVAEVGKLVNK
jgi:hypothetical protein